MDKPTDPQRDATAALKQVGQNLTSPPEPCPQCGAKPTKTLIGVQPFVTYHKPNCPAYGLKQ